MTDTSVDETHSADARVRTQVEDALELSNYVVSSGVKGSAGQLLALDDIATIQKTAALIGLIDVKSDAPVPAGRSAGSITISEWSDFELAYYRLASTLAPVTAETLRNTRGVAQASRGGFIGRLVNRFRGDGSPAQHFTNRLWICTIFFALFVIFAELGINVLGAKTNQNDLWVKGPRDLLLSLQPWAYGGLGACAYMLRSAHYFIYQRSFDVRRTPEYYNRILLGAISGGAIILFITNLSNDDGSSINLGAAALGFVAGYSTDLLFNTIERIVTAIFPKVAVETVPADSSMARTAPKRTTPPAPTPAPGSVPADEKGKGRSRTTTANVSGTGTTPETGTGT
jgi:hypothetical protein